MQQVQIFAQIFALFGYIFSWYKVISETVHKIV